MVSPLDKVGLLVPYEIGAVILSSFPSASLAGSWSGMSSMASALGPHFSPGGAGKCVEGVSVCR